MNFRKNAHCSERFNLLSGQVSDDDIPVIPDMDDLPDDALLDNEVPDVTVNRVATYNELNSELLRQSAFASLEDIDLSILAKCLQSEVALNEPDEAWEWEKLFTEVSADIHSEKPKSADTIAHFVN